MPIQFQPTTLADGEALARLRVLAMKDSLQALGRFDPERARQRFLSAFDPQYTCRIVLDGVLVGFWVLKPQATDWLLDHLYVAPGHQSQGIGTQVLGHVFDRADQAGQVLRLGALKGSRSNAFYLRHGFVKIDEGEWDICYERQPVNAH